MQQVEFNKKLKDALRGFAPVFGNSADIAIAEDIGRLRKKLGEIDHVAFRKMEDEGDLSKLTPKMKDIQGMERNLVHRITYRNLDF